MHCVVFNAAHCTMAKLSCVQKGVTGCVCVCCVVWVGQSKELGLEVKHQPPKQESTRPQWLCECTRLSGRCNLKGNCVPFSHAQICDVIFIVSRFTE